MGNNYSVQAPVTGLNESYKKLLEFPKQPQFSSDSKATVPMVRPKEQQASQPKTSNFYGLEVETDLVKEVKSEKFGANNIRTVTLKNGMSIEYGNNLNNKKAQSKVYCDEEGFTTFENIPSRADILIDGTSGNDKIALKNSNLFSVATDDGNDVIKVENSSPRLIFSHEKLTLIDGVKDRTKAPSLKGTKINCSEITNNLLWTEDVKTDTHFFDKKY